MVDEPHPLSKNAAHLCGLPATAARRLDALLGQPRGISRNDSPSALKASIIGLTRAAKGSSSALFFARATSILGFSQCAWLWSPTTFASLFGSEHQFCSVEPLLWIVAVESCKDSDLSTV